MRIKKEFKNPAQEQNIWVEAGEKFFLQCGTEMSLDCR